MTELVKAMELLQVEDQVETPPSNDNRSLKRKSRTRSTTPINDEDRAAKQALLLMTRPSYGLGLGSKLLMSENRARLTHLLRGLLSQHNWAEACGVLSVILKCTSSDKSAPNNRFKYTALMEVLANIGDGYLNDRKIKNIFDIWIKKTESLKGHPVENEFLVRLEFIAFCLTKGNLEAAHQAALWLMQERKFGKDPIENMIVGITFYQLWLSKIPKDILWTENDQTSTTSSQSSDACSYSEGCDSANSNKASTGFRCDSATSVRNDKVVPDDSDNSLRGDNPFRVESIKVENFSEGGVYANSAEGSGNETSTSNRAGRSPRISNLSVFEGLNPSLFPIKLPQSVGDGENLFQLHINLLNDYHKEALKYLRLAVCSTSPVMEALVPFIQLLLVGGQVDEALKEIDNLCCNSNALLPIRLRASLLEHFNRNNSAMLSTCFEDILNKDPTCAYALEKLITMNHSGEYSSESLLEMIGWHLDSTYANHEIWKEFASCFLKLSEQEEDRMSVFLDENEGGIKQRYSVSFNKAPKLFTEGVSGKNWMLRCRWWLNRYFNHGALETDIAAGDLELLTYKAACASHFYGPDFSYVMGVYTCLEKQKETELFSFLRLSIAKSIKLYSSQKENSARYR